MIRLSNGHEIKYVSASGALGYNGKGWPWEWPYRWVGLLDPKQFSNVAKTFTLEPRKGNMRWRNPFYCFRFLPNKSALNSIGLTNPGIKWAIDKLCPRLRPDYNMILSISPFTVQEAQEMIPYLDKAQNIVAVEVNLSCPNTEHFCALSDESIKILEVLKAGCKFPLIAKIGYTYPNELIKKVSELVEAIEAINTVPWDEMYPHQHSPLMHLGGGGVSGSAITGYSLAKVKQIKEICDIPVIGGGGIMSLEDAVNMLHAGADAIAFGTLFIYSPAQPNKIVKQLEII